MRVHKRAVVRSAMVTSIAAASAMLVTAACSSDREPSVMTEADGGATDASPLPTSEAGDVTAAPDARPPFDPTPEPVVCTADPCAVELVAGAQHFCARMSDGTVRCWGDDVWGQLGHGDGPTSADAGAIPPVVNLSNVVELSATGHVTCARLADGSVSCWGWNIVGELGLSTDDGMNDYDRHPTPTPVALGDAIATRIEVGHFSACAATTTGKLLCWGNGWNQKLARPVVDRVRAPFEIVLAPGEAKLDPLTFAKTRSGTRTSIGVTTDGNVFSWGAMSGEEGLVSGRISSRSPDLTPRRIEQLTNVTSLAVSPILYREDPNAPPRQGPPGHAHACAIANGEVYCWGRSFTGALCTGLPDPEQEPRSAPVSATAWPQQVAVGDETTCIRLTDGTVQCCGENINGALARNLDETFSAYFLPATAFKSHAVHVAASEGSICALVQGGTVECWGTNTHGELGMIPDREAHPSPMKITF
jgi:Regulator of chromosome condensation (RCC1) repeat